MCALQVVCSETIFVLLPLFSAWITGSAWGVDEWKDEWMNGKKMG